MTRKDFELIALNIRTTRPAFADASFSERYRWDMLVRQMVEDLAMQNPRFDSQRFIKACGGFSEVAA